MKQLTCPCCATILERPNGNGDCTLTCLLCGEKLRLSRSGSAARKAPAPPVPSSTTVKPHPLPPLPVAPKARAAVSAPPRSQARRAPTPAAKPTRSPWPWIAILALLLLIAAAVLWQAVRSSRPGDRSVDPVAREDTPPAQTAPAPGPASEPEPEQDPEPAGPVAEPQLREVVHIDARGDGKIVRHYRFPAQAYSQIKRQVTSSDVNRLRRQFGLRQHWQEIGDFQAECQDAACTVRVRFGVRGLARMGDGQLWEARLADEPGLSQVSGHQNEGVFTGQTKTEFGPPALLTRTVRAPQGAAGVKLRSSPARIVFRMPAPTAGAAAGDPRFELHAKANLMACAGRAYGQPQFTRWWTARTLFKNDSGDILRDYAVRFRLGEYSPDWKELTCPLVVPGQTVVDAYFPVLDNDRLVKQTDACRVQLEVEYQYRRGDGPLVQKRETRTIRMLSRNQVLSTSLPPHEWLDQLDQSEDMREVLAALVVPDDPVIKEVEGRVAGVMGRPHVDVDLVEKINRPPDKSPPRPISGLAASSDPVDTYKLMKGIYYFMSTHIHYTHPSGNLFDGRHAQTVMYGRDVLQHRAGTCIDLAILYASLCQAGGADAYLVLLPDHCYPLIRLPRPLLLPQYDLDGKPLVDGEGKITVKSVQELGVESVRIGARPFEAAWMEGRLKTQAHLEKGDLEVIPIAKQHAHGVHPLSLPALALKDLGINEEGSWTRLIPGFGGAVAQGGPAQGERPHGRVPEGRQPGGGQGRGFLPGTGPEAGGPPAATVVGRWHATGRLPDGTAYEWTLTLGKDKTFKSTSKLAKVMARGQVVPAGNIVLVGTYKVAAETIEFTTNDGAELVWEYRLANTRLTASLSHLQTGKVWLNFVRLPD